MDKCIEKEEKTKATDPVIVEKPHETGKDGGVHKLDDPPSNPGGSVGR